MPSAIRLLFRSLPGEVAEAPHAVCLIGWQVFYSAEACEQNGRPAVSRRGPSEEGGPPLLSVQGQEGASCPRHTHTQVVGHTAEPFCTADRAASGPQTAASPRSRTPAHLFIHLALSVAFLCSVRSVPGSIHVLSETWLPPPHLNSPSPLSFP